MPTVRKICRELTAEIEATASLLCETMTPSERIAIARFRLYVTDTVRGRCKYADRTLTVPKWAYDKGTEYFVYYVAHEIAHIIAGHDANHGPKFMAAFKAICPRDYWHYETEYKPRNAAAAGIAMSAEQRAKRRAARALGRVVRHFDGKQFITLT